MEPETKVFGDPIHGNIEFHPLLVKIIDTPQFQRLRNLKQLGVTYFVYPGAAHNRFEHSLGVSYLAGKLVRHLKKKQSNLGIDDKDILCVQIAGLCHDLGHGPFSHTFENRFIPFACPSPNWKHERASLKMFDHLCAVNGLDDDFNKYNLNDHDIFFIKELIAGPPPDPSESIAGQLSAAVRTEIEWRYKGRPKSKGFLYQVVSNSVNGVDVDKWDYVARDSYHLDIPNSFDHKRLIKFARVVEGTDGRQNICVRDKEIDSLYHMCSSRLYMHRIAYQHKTTVIVDYMLGEALKLANDHIKVLGTDGRRLKMSEAIHDMVAFTNLDDSIYHKILYSRDPNLRKAKELLQCIEKRQLYRLVGQAKPRKYSPRKYSESRDAPDAIVKDLVRQSGDTLNASQIIVEVCVLHSGMGVDNPVDRMQFYTKQQPFNANKPSMIEDQVMRKKTHGERTIRVYVKDQNDVEPVQQHFVAVCRHLQLRQGSDPEEVRVMSFGN